MDGGLLVGSDIATLVGLRPCVVVLVEVVDGGLLVDCDIVTLVGAWP